jgi:hypothetical protein
MITRATMSLLLDQTSADVGEGGQRYFELGRPLWSHSLATVTGRAHAR